LVLVGGDSAEKAFGSLFPDLAETLRNYGWSNVKAELVKDSGHYVIDEQPEAWPDSSNATRRVKP
jgi:hypothetical protein